jgi:hypothetical protein
MFTFEQGLAIILVIFLVAVDDKITILNLTYYLDSYNNKQRLHKSLLRPLAYSLLGLS